MKPMKMGVFWALALAASAAVALSAQPPPEPRGQMLREPYRPSRTVTMVPPPAGAPIELESTATLNLAYPLERATLVVRLRSRHPAWLPASGLTVRLALGPVADDGTFTLRMRPRASDGPTVPPVEPGARDLLPGVWETVAFTRVSSEPLLPLSVMNEGLRIVAALESVEDATGRDLWSHPDVEKDLRDSLRLATSAPGAR